MTDFFKQDASTTSYFFDFRSLLIWSDFFMNVSFCPFAGAAGVPAPPHMGKRLNP